MRSAGVIDASALTNPTDPDPTLHLTGAVQITERRYWESSPTTVRASLGTTAPPPQQDPQDLYRSPPAIGILRQHSSARHKAEKRDVLRSDQPRPLNGQRKAFKHDDSGCL